MSVTSYKQLLLKSRPSGNLKDSDFELTETTKAELEDGQVFVKNILASIDPTQRIWASDGPQYMEELQLNTVMRAFTTGVVMESKHADYSVGDVVVGPGMVQEYYVGIPGQTVQGKLEPKPSSVEEIATFMGPLSVVIGLTAYVGLEKILAPDDKSIVLVSAAAGAVGSMVAQLAKLRGATVIGVAGSDAKVAWLRDELKVDHAFNYKTDDLMAKFKEVAPEGITHYFDNTAGPITEAFMMNSAIGGKVCVCGAIAEYNAEQPSGIKSWGMIITRRLSIQGLLVLDHIPKMGEFLEFAVPKVKSGEIKYKVDIREGIENYVATVNELFTGGNKGKLLLKIGDLPA